MPYTHLTENERYVFSHLKRGGIRGQANYYLLYIIRYSVYFTTKPYLNLSTVLLVERVNENDNAPPKPIAAKIYISLKIWLDDDNPINPMNGILIMNKPIAIIRR